MPIVARRTLRQFWEQQPRAEASLVRGCVEGTMGRPNGVKDQFGTTFDFVPDNRVIFDLGGNKFRLVAHVSYPFGRVLVKFIGTHAEYDRIDPKAVSWQKK